MVRSIGAIVLASGDSRRFDQGNKLLVPWQGKPLIAHVLDVLPPEAFVRRLVVTRWEAVAQVCFAMGAEVLLHHQPDISDTVRLGVEALGQLDGCLFAVGDQPRLSRTTVCNILSQAEAHPQSILRACENGEMGNPVLFPRDCYPALRALPPGRGGSWLAQRESARVRGVEVAESLELFDIDTLKDYELLQKTKEGCNE